MRQPTMRSSSVKSGHGAAATGWSAAKSIAWSWPSNDANSQRVPSRTPFSVSGSFTTSKKTSLRVAFARCPVASSSTCSAVPLPQRVPKRLPPVG